MFYKNLMNCYNGKDLIIGCVCWKSSELFSGAFLNFLTIYTPTDFWGKFFPFREMLVSIFSTQKQQTCLMSAVSEEVKVC